MKTYKIYFETYRKLMKTYKKSIKTYENLDSTFDEARCLTKKSTICASLVSSLGI